MNQTSHFNSIHLLIVAAGMIGGLGLLALSGSAAPASTSQDWADVMVGFGLLILGLGGWWVVRRELKFK